jgi:hypothetical protein
MYIHIYRIYILMFKKLPTNITTSSYDEPVSIQSLPCDYSSLYYHDDDDVT